MLVVVLLIGGSLLYAFRVPCLTALGRWWSANEPVSPVDVLVVLSGDPEYRPAAAAKLFLDRTCPLVLLTHTEPSWQARKGFVPDTSELYMSLLLAHGIPAAAVQWLGTNATSTYDEASAFRQWAATNNIRSALVLTHAVHARRTAWVFRRQLRGTKLRVSVVGIETPAISATNWWQSEHGLLMMQNEWVKYLYYRMKY